MTIKNKKWTWAGHRQRTDNRWATKGTEWQPRYRHESWQKTRWRDKLRPFTGAGWSILSWDKENWRTLGETSILQWSGNDDDNEKEKWNKTQVDSDEEFIIPKVAQAMLHDSNFQLHMEQVQWSGWIQCLECKSKHKCITRMLNLLQWNIVHEPNSEDNDEAQEWERW